MIDLSLVHVLYNCFKVTLLVKKNLKKIYTLLDILDKEVWNHLNFPFICPYTSIHSSIIPVHPSIYTFIYLFFCPFLFTYTNAVGDD